MSTSPIWTVHCDSARVVEMREHANGMSSAVKACHSWVGQEDSARLAQALARASGWKVVGRYEAYCPPCAELLPPPT